MEEEEIVRGAQVIAAVLRFLRLYLVLSLILGGLLLLQIFPVLPSSPFGWVLLFALGVPVTFIGEAVGRFLVRVLVPRRWRE